MGIGNADRMSTIFVWFSGVQDSIWIRVWVECPPLRQASSTHYAYATWAYLHCLIFARRISRQVVSASATATVCHATHWQQLPPDKFTAAAAACLQLLQWLLLLSKLLRRCGAVALLSARIECVALKCSINSARQAAECKLKTATGNSHTNQHNWHTNRGQHFRQPPGAVLIYCLYVMQCKAMFRCHSWPTLGVFGWSLLL